jgi:hypothetical protein
MTATGEPRRLGLEVWFEADRIDGRVYDQEDASRLDRRFSGWLGLLSALAETAPGHEPAALSHGKRNR